MMRWKTTSTREILIHLLSISNCIDYLIGLSLALGKEVVLTAENDTPKSYNVHLGWQPLLAVNGEQIRVQAYWLASQP